MDTISSSFDFIEVKESPVHGFGAFAKRDIPKGTVWWKGEIEHNVLLLNKAQYQNFQLSARNPIKAEFEKMVAIYSYYSAKLDALIICLDNARYVNHSAEPNSGSGPDQDPLQSIALRDIKKGEEILEDYHGYDVCPWFAENNIFLKE